MKPAFWTCALHVSLVPKAPYPACKKKACRETKRKKRKFSNFFFMLGTTLVQTSTEGGTLLWQLNWHAARLRLPWRWWVEPWCSYIVAVRSAKMTDMSRRTCFELFLLRKSDLDMWNASTCILGSDKRVDSFLVCMVVYIINRCLIFYNDTLPSPYRYWKQWLTSSANASLRDVEISKSRKDFDLRLCWSSRGSMLITSWDVIFLIPKFTALPKENCWSSKIHTHSGCRRRAASGSRRRRGDGLLFGWGVRGDHRRASSSG